MSNSDAISAVTSILQQLLETRLHAFDSGTSVTTKPPDKARGGTLTPSQLNLFLMRTSLNAAWRNMDPPRQVRAGEGGFPALPLDLHYMITAYGLGDDDVDAHKVLGRALLVLHDTPILPRTHTLAISSGLSEQFELLRITPEVLTLEELSKMWTTFQAQYRISSSFQVSVVLLDSARPPRSSLPVLTRGEDDRGVSTTTSRLPVLEAVLPPPFIPAPRLGETLTLAGSNLSQPNLTAVFRNFRLAGPLELTPAEAESSERLPIRLPDAGSSPTALDDWAAGVYSVALSVRNPDLPVWASNEVLFALAPRIVVTPNMTTGPVSAGDVVTLECTPHVRAEQAVRVLFGDRQLELQSLTPPANPGDPSLLTVVVPGIAAGDYPLRLRIDGADSLPLRIRNNPGSAPRPEFDPEQTVRVA